MSASIEHTRSLNFIAAFALALAGAGSAIAEDAIPKPDCTTPDDKPGFLVQTACFAADATELYFDARDGFESFADLSPLRGFTALKRLSLSDTAVSNLTPLADLTALEWLVPT